MTVPQWWTNEWWIALLFNVLQSSLGALLGLLGVFGAYLWTRSDERKKVSKQRALDGAGKVLRRAADLRRLNDDQEDRAHALSDELLLFSVQERAERPNVSAWAFHHSMELDEWADNLYVVAAVTGVVIGNMSNWTASPDLKDDLLTEDQAKETWRRILAQYAIEEAEEAKEAELRAQIQAQTHAHAEDSVSED